MSGARAAIVAAFAVATMSCGKKDIVPTGTSGTTTPGAKTMVSTYNGVTFTPNVMTSAYQGGQTSVNAADGTRNFSINAINILQTGTYSLAAGNANSAFGQWTDGVGIYSTLAAGGGGTVTFTLIQLGRVAGAFNFVAKNTANGATNSVLLNGTFDIAFP